ncbi:hypothetical protein [Streptomyces albus]|uniref:hypothetical protein n=1 Tax=Streptomyces sp. PHES57 TaxID=2872626 RepID=UPI001CECECBC|nr:hypothetical protein [Streptomyces sp. PHES57]
MFIDEDVALSYAERFLEEKSKEWGEEGALRLDKENSSSDGDTLIALYDTIAYLDHGDEKQRLGGNMPIKVDMRTGTCRLLSFEEVLEYINKGLIQ